MPVNTTWNGDANDNKLATAGNWSNDAVPGTTTNATIATGENIYATGSVQFQSLTLNSSTTDIIDTGAITVSGALTIQQGAIDVENGGSLLTSGGITIDSSAELYMIPLSSPASNATVTGNIVNDGQLAADGATLTVNGSVTGTGTIEVGEQGEGGALDLNGASNELIVL